MAEETILDILKRTGALLSDDHFVYTSGKHGSFYINKDYLYLHTEETSKVGKMLGERFADKDIDVVVGPALGGIILAQWTAYHLSKTKGKEVLSVYTEKTPDGGQILTRGYDQYIVGKNVLIVEDTTMTGGSVKKVVDTIKAAGGNIIGVSVMTNRDPVDINESTIGAPFSALGILDIPAFDAADCELCKKGIPVNTKIGKGKNFVKK